MLSLKQMFIFHHIQLDEIEIRMKMLNLETIQQQSKEIFSKVMDFVQEHKLQSMLLLLLLMVKFCQKQFLIYQNIVLMFTPHFYLNIAVQGLFSGAF